MASTLTSHRGKDGGGLSPEETLIVATPIDLRQARRLDGRTGVGTSGTGIGEAGDPSCALTANSQAVAFHATQDPISGRIAAALGAEASCAIAVAAGACVRRLMPVECERLQALPDDWTLVDFKGKPAADSPRYAGIGDAVTATVGEWTGRRIIRATDGSS